MKGFVRILEAIIAALIILTALSFFFPITAKQTTWPEGISELRVRDILGSGIENGDLRTLDPNAIKSYISSKLPESFDLSVEIEGIPPSEIYIECIQCSVSSRLGDIVTYKERVIDFIVDDDRSSEFFSIKDETDILFFSDFSILAGLYSDESDKAAIDRFLVDGGALFVMGGLSESDIDNNEELLKGIFGLEWLGSGSAEGYFYESNKPELASFRVAKYYTDINTVDKGGTGIEDFNFVSSGISVDYRSVVVGGSNSYVKVNDNVLLGSGRAVWFNSHSETQNMDTLLKASVMWAADDGFTAIGGEPGDESQVVSAVVYDKDPYTLKITVWQVF